MGDDESNVRESRSTGPDLPANRGGQAFRRRTQVRLALTIIAALGVAGSLLIGGVSWYIAGEIESSAFRVSHDADRSDLVVEAVSGDILFLVPAGTRTPGASWRRAGTFGLEWVGGYGQVGAILAETAGRVSRRFILLEGSLTAGTPVRVDPFAFPRDPRAAFGYEFEEIAVMGRAGALPAWFVGPASETWAVLVHGQNASRREMLRTIRPLHEQGVSVLVISYRNDEGAPASPDGKHHFGVEEWIDLDDAVAYARDHGARHILLAGNSMGGAIVMAFLQRSALAPLVQGLVLDAPMLNLRSTIAFRAPNMLPGWVMAAGELLTTLRFDVDWNTLNYLATAKDLQVPILLFHGDADDKVPVATSYQLARSRPDIVTFRRTAEAGHVRSWNANPATYEQAIREFVAALSAH